MTHGPPVPRARRSAWGCSGLSPAGRGLNPGQVQGKRWLPGPGAENVLFLLPSAQNGVCAWGAPRKGTAVLQVLGGIC